MEYKYARFFKLFNSFLDYLILNVSLITAYYFVIPEGSEGPVIGLKLYVLLANLIWFFSTTQTELYNKILKTDAVPYLNKSIWTLVIFAVASFGLHFLMPEILITDFQLLKTLVVFAAAMLSSKVVFLYVRKSQRRFWIDYKKVVILGCGPAAKELCEYFSDHNSGFIVEGFFCDEACPSIGNFKFLGTLDESVRYCASNDVSEIFSTLPSGQIATVKDLMEQADSNMVRFRFVPELSELMNKDMLIEFYGALPIVSKLKEPLEIKVNQIVKDAFDYTFSLLTVVFLFSWLFPLIAIAIKIDSRGPIFFRQLRTGKDNKPFFCLKFRSMYINELSDTKQAVRGDSRITAVGAFMRKTNLDELPQFLNVLMGDMSIVGPRPHMLKHTEEYSKVINDYMVRQFAAPGITGWAQINGLRGETKETESMVKRVKADIWYLENWSFLLDLKIVFLTVIQSFAKNEKAY